MNSKVKSKDVLIETASRLFKVRGYCGVGLNDIIEESGIPKGSLYYYFPEGKEQLAIAAIENTKKLVMEDIEGSKAHVKMLGNCGILTEDESSLILSGLETLKQKADAGELEYSSANEDIHLNLEKFLIDEHGKLVHRFRSATNPLDPAIVNWVKN